MNIYFYWTLCCRCLSSHVILIHAPWPHDKSLGNSIFSTQRKQSVEVIILVVSSFIVRQACYLTIRVTSRRGKASASGSASTGSIGGVQSSSTICTTHQRAKWVSLSWGALCRSAFSSWHGMRWSTIHFQPLHPIAKKGKCYKPCNKILTFMPLFTRIITSIMQWCLEVQVCFVLWPHS